MSPPPVYGDAAEAPGDYTSSGIPRATSASSIDYKENMSSSTNGCAPELGSDEEGPSLILFTTTVTTVVDTGPAKASDSVSCESGATSTALLTTRTTTAAAAVNSEVAEALADALNCDSITESEAVEAVAEALQHTIADEVDMATAAAAAVATNVVSDPENMFCKLDESAISSVMGLVAPKVQEFYFVPPTPHLSAVTFCPSDSEDDCFAACAATTNTSGRRSVAGLSASDSFGGGECEGFGGLCGLEGLSGDSAPTVGETIAMPRELAEDDRAAVATTTTTVMVPTDEVGTSASVATPGTDEELEISVQGIFVDESEVEVIGPVANAALDSTTNSACDSTCTSTPSLPPPPSSSESASASASAATSENDPRAPAVGDVECHVVVVTAAELEEFGVDAVLEQRATERAAAQERERQRNQPKTRELELSSESEGGLPMVGRQVGARVPSGLDPGWSESDDEMDNSTPNFETLRLLGIIADVPRAPTELDLSSDTASNVGSVLGLNQPSPLQAQQQHTRQPYAYPPHSRSMSSISGFMRGGSELNGGRGARPGSSVRAGPHSGTTRRRPHTDTDDHDDRRSIEGSLPPRRGTPTTPLGLVHEGLADFPIVTSSETSTSSNSLQHTNNTSSLESSSGGASANTTTTSTTAAHSRIPPTPIVGTNTCSPTLPVTPPVITTDYLEEGEDVMGSLPPRGEYAGARMRWSSAGAVGGSASGTGSTSSTRSVSGDIGFEWLSDLIRSPTVPPPSVRGRMPSCPPSLCEAAGAAKYPFKSGFESLSTNSLYLSTPPDIGGSENGDAAEADGNNPTAGPVNRSVSMGGAIFQASEWQFSGTAEHASLSQFSTPFTSASSGMSARFPPHNTNTPLSDIASESEGEGDSARTHTAPNVPAFGIDFSMLAASLRNASSSSRSGSGRNNNKNKQAADACDDESGSESEYSEGADTTRDPSSGRSASELVSSAAAVVGQLAPSPEAAAKALAAASLGSAEWAGERIDPLSVFPDEVFILVLTHLSHHDVLRCERVCKEWSEVCSSNWLWRLRWESRFGADTLHEHVIDWRRVYKEMVREESRNVYEYGRSYNH